MKFPENFSEKVTNVARSAAEEAGKLTDSARLRIRMMEAKSKLETSFAKFGKLSYENMKKSGTIPAGYEKLFSTITIQIAELEELTAGHAAARNRKICPSCKAVIDADAAFCPRCGAKQAEDTPKNEEAVNRETVEETVSDAAEEIRDDVLKVSEDVAETVDETAETVAEAVSETAETVAEEIQEAADAIAEEARETAEELSNI